MVFSNLRDDEKEAFFGLLDEYFTSRPEVLAHLAAQSSGSTPSAVASKAASAVQRAVASKPDIAARFTSSAARHQATPSTTANQGNDTNEDEDEQPVSVAARMAAFASKHASQPPPGRGPPPVAPKPSASGLVTSKTFGGIDTTSTRNALGSIYANRSGAKPAEPPQPPPAPPAFPKRNNFAPPPGRGAASSTPPPPPPRAPSPPPPEPEEEEEQGEWAEALYAYSSNEPADLSFNEDDRILIVERTSDDWWTGECNGRRGLLPASYVKLL